jgi:membrane associated rhomboid family serine protease
VVIVDLRRIGVRRFPALTLVVFAVTLAVNLAQMVNGRILADLERTPAGLHGDWWRTGTSLLVQDGGVWGTVSNLLFLVLVGVTAEQVASRGRWLLGYLGAALVGELAGYAWQPVGGGNSIAICGLAGLVALALYRGETLYRGDARMPPFGVPVLFLWCGALLATWWYPLIGVGIAAMMLSRAVPIGADPRYRRLGLGFVVVVGVLLCAVRNIHGAALLTGLVLATVPVDRRTD